MRNEPLQINLNRLIDSYYLNLMSRSIDCSIVCTSNFRFLALHLIAQYARRKRDKLCAKLNYIFRDISHPHWINAYRIIDQASAVSTCNSMTRTQRKVSSLSLPPPLLPRLSQIINLSVVRACNIDSDVRVVCFTFALITRIIDTVSYTTAH